MSTWKTSVSAASVVGAWVFAGAAPAGPAMPRARHTTPPNWPSAS